MTAPQAEPARVAAFGIDAGSTTCKVAAVDASGSLVASVLRPALPGIDAQTAVLLQALRDDTGADGSEPVVATGYGRKLVSSADARITEITCHAVGVFRDLGLAGTLIDIGGQDSKVIRIGPDGRPADFAMNDKCAAGTGRFLEHTAGRLGIALDELGARAVRASDEAAITSTCTVFAESEVISLVAEGVDLDVIVRGLHRSLIRRIVAMARAVGVVAPVMLSGGVVLNESVPVLLEEELGQPVVLPSHPQLMGAYGAALLACKRYAKEETC